MDVLARCAEVPCQAPRLVEASLRCLHGLTFDSEETWGGDGGDGGDEVWGAWGCVFFLFCGICLTFVFFLFCDVVVFFFLLGCAISGDLEKFESVVEFGRFLNAFKRGSIARACF